MTHLKKSLALLLAIIMIFSSMSVMASAAGDSAATSADEHVGFVVKFFRNENRGKTDASGKALPESWVETKKAAPGEEVRARVYVETNFGTHSFSLGVLFDTRFFDHSKFEDNKRTSLNKNSGYQALDKNGNLIDFSIHSANGWWWEEGMSGNYLSDAYSDNYFVDEGFVDASYFTNMHIIEGAVTSQYPFVVKYTYGDLEKADNWMVEYPFEVKNDPYTNEVNKFGSTKVPVELRQDMEHFSDSKGELVVDFAKGELGNYYWDKMQTLGSGWEIKSADSVPGELTTTGEIYLDPNGGQFGTSTDRKEVAGIINTSAYDEINAAAVDLKADGQTFIGWSNIKTEKGAELTDEILEAINFSGMTSEQIEALGWEVTETLAAGYLTNVAAGTDLTAEMIEQLDLANKTATQLNGYGLTVSRGILDALKLDTAVYNFGYKYGDEDKDKDILYAMWDHSGMGTYRVETYLISEEEAMRLYDKDPSNDPVLKPSASDPFDFEIGEKVPLQATSRTGYTFLPEISSDSVTIKADGSSVLKAYYVKNIYEVNYHYEDGLEDRVEEFEVPYDELIPEFSAVPGGIPQKAGHTFVGWALNEDGTGEAPVRMPALKDENGKLIRFTVKEDGSLVPANANDDIILDLYPVFTKNTYLLTFDTTETAQFSNGQRTVSLAFNYGDVVTVKGTESGTEIYDEEGNLLLTVENPDTGYTGTSFIGWDIFTDETLTEVITITNNILVVAAYDVETYTVNFVDDNGNEIGSIDGYLYGDILEKVDTPEGYRDNAWLLPDGKLAAFPLEITGNITLTAVEGSNTYDAVFDANGGEWTNATENKTYTVTTVPTVYGEDIVAPADPSRAGYEFKGWSEDATATQADASLGTMDTVNGKTFYAVYEAINITLSFNSDGGKPVADIVLPCDSDLKAPVTTREGYEFTGWVDKDGKPIPETVPAENTTYTATWRALYYNVIYKNGDALVGDVKQAATDSPVTVIDTVPVKEGHKFTGWQIKGGDGTLYNKNETFTMPAKDVILEAQWTENIYVIELDANGGTFANGEDRFDKNNVPYGEALNTVVPAEDPTWATAEKTFKGWAAADDVTETIVYGPGALQNATMPSKNLNLKAVWNDVIEPEYKVTFRANGGKFSDGSETIVKYYKTGEIIVPPVPIKDGFNYAWDTTVADKMGTEDLTYVAIWSAKEGDIDLKINVYIQTIDKDNKEVETLTEVIYEDYGIDGQTVAVYDNTADSVVIPDTTFKIPFTSLTNSAGNIPDPGHAGEKLSLTLENGGDNTLTVYFKLAERTATFNPNGGTFADNEEDGEVKGLHGTAITAPAVTRPGYEFKGWMDEDGTVFEPDAALGTFVKDETYTAVWEEIKYNVEFDSNGGVPVAEGGSYAPGKSVILPAVSKEGYRFDGWQIKDGDGTLYKAGYTYTMPEKAVEFVAQWTPVYTATYADKDGNTIKSFELAEGEAIPAIAQSDVPEVDGFRFTGWTGMPEDRKMPAADVTFTADYAKLYTLTYAYSQTVAGAPDLPTGGEYIEGETVVLPAYSPINGYRVEGWYTDENCEDKDKINAIKFDMPGSDTTLYLKVKEVFTLSFKNGEGTPIPSVDLTEDDMAANDGAGYQLTVPTVRDGHIFKHWVDKNGTEYSLNSYIVFYEDTVLTAVWEEVTQPSTTAPPATYTVTFDEDGGKLVADVIKEAGESFNLPNTSRDGFDFLGWADEEGNIIGGAGDRYTMPEGGIALKAMWVEKTTATVPTTTEPVPTEPQTFKLSFAYAEDDDIPDNAPVLLKDIPVVDGATYTLPALPELEGYEFDGWYDEKGIRYPAGYEYPVTKDTVLTANCKEKVTQPAPTDPPTTTEPAATYTATFDVDGGSDVTNITREANETFNLPSVTKEGYIFKGWADESGTVIGGAGDEYTMPEGGIALKAVWEAEPVPPTEYDLIFEVNGGSSVDNEKLKEGQVINLPTTSLADYEFLGWADETGKIIGKAGDKFTMPAKNVTLTAEWKAIPTPEYKVSYEYIGPEIPVPTPAKPGESTVKQGDTVVVAPLPAPIEGYSFIGWYYNGKLYNETSTDLVMPGADIVLEGIWTSVDPELGEYIVSYRFEGDVPDGATAPAPVVYKEKSPVTIESAPASVEGYTFKGWFIGSEPAADFTMPASNVEIVGKWEINKNDIVFDANGGEFSDGSAQSTKENVEYGKKLSEVLPEAPEKTGYTFKGWVDSNGNPAPETMPDGALELIATWEANEYRITFDANGGKYSDGSTSFYKDYKYDDKIGAVDAPPTREGFTFTGWSPEIPDTMPDYNVTVYAQWEAIPGVKTYTITFDTDGGSAVPSATYIAGEAVTEPAAPTKEGYIFKGWEPALPSTMPESDITVKAIWEEVIPEVKSHTVTYYLVKVEDGTSEVYTTKTFEEGEAMAHPVPAVEGFTFKGWVDENGNALPDTMGTSDINAYANLEINTYKVTYLLDASGEVYKEYADVVFASEVPVPADPTKEGYVFAGWDPAVAASMPSHNLTYTAKWVLVPTGDEYTARYVVDDKTYALYVLEEGDTIPVPASPKKFGFVFVGWEPEVPATMPGENVEFVAQWEIDKTFVGLVIGGVVVSGVVVAGVIGANAAWITAVSIVGGIIVIVGTAHLIKNTHTVTYMVDGEVYKVYKVVEGTKIPVPADPAKDGSKFTGWNPEVPEKMGETDLVFEATWEDVAAADDDVVIPDTGSAAGIAAFAVISGAAAAAYVITSRKKKEN